MLPCALAILLLRLPSVALGARAQGPDTALALEGFLQQDDQSSAWTLVVPLSVEAFHIRTFTLTLVGLADHWRDLRNLYVAAKGRLSRVGDPDAPHLSLAVQDMREATPPGTVARTFDHGVGMRSRATLSVIPARFAWVDARGRPTGVNPLVLYTMLNQRIGAVEVIQPTDLSFCVRVFHDGMITWDSTFTLGRTDARSFETQSGALREGVQLPRTAAKHAGHYTALAGVCEAASFNLTAAFDVE